MAIRTIASTVKGDTDNLVFDALLSHNGSDMPVVMLYTETLQALFSNAFNSPLGR